MNLEEKGKTTKNLT